MNVPKSVQPFWDKFQASIAYDASPLFYEAFHFDDNEPSANALAALVLSGQKRATAGLLWTNERTNKPLPRIGSLSVVTDWQGAPLCIIESTHIEVVPFDSVSDGFAVLEGGGRQDSPLLAGSSLAILLQRVPAHRQGAGPAHACSV